MSLKTVKVPAEMAPAFEAAEQVVSRFFGDRRDEPARGTIEIFGERYVLVRAAALSVEFFSLVRELYGEGRQNEADEFARNILFDLAHAVGKSDAQNFHAKMGLNDPIARLSAGPVHFAHSGWAFVDIFPESRPTPGPDFFLVYDHPYSFESDAWSRAGRRSDFPVCIMNAGYSSGWCEESFGIELVATEILCRARGDDCCRFVMAQPDRIEAYLRDYVQSRVELAGIRGHEIPDFFARKRMEEQLRRERAELEDRVAERTAELRREMAEREKIEATLRQSQKLEAIGRLAGGVAHDFNNLMGVVIGRAALIRDRLPEGDPLREELSSIKEAGECAAALTQQLLAFSRSQVLRHEVLDVGTVVREIIGVLGPLLGDDVEVKMSLAEGLDLVEADRGQLQQVVMNLVLNGRDAMPAGGAVTIGTRLTEKPDRSANLGPGRWVELSVADSGVGMDEETMSRLFEPFFTRKEQGRGLGLATVYGIVKQSLGGIAVWSQPGRGSRFSVYLPGVREAPRAVAPEADAATGDRGTETILLVEDRDNLRETLRDALGGYGYRVLAAESPRVALALAESHPDAIHAVLTDVVMPQMGGAELVRQLHERRADLRVIYMSGFAPEAVLREDVLERSAFLQKPFTPEQLARKLREVLDGHGR